MSNLFGKMMFCVRALVVVALMVLAVMGYRYWNARATRNLISSTVQSNSPIAELATREIIWRVVIKHDGTFKDVFSDTVFTIKVGYDFEKVFASQKIDHANKVVTFILPQPKIVSIDHFLTRISQDKQSFVARVFSATPDIADLDRQSLSQLIDDVARYNLFSIKQINETLESLLRDQYTKYGYELKLVAPEIPDVKLIFREYLASKGMLEKLEAVTE